MTPEELLENIVEDLKIKLGDMFDQNFSDKAFFGQPWKKSKQGLIATGALRNSVEKPSIEGNKLVWRSSLTYASIHNEGGEIVVTQKMKKFFWAKYLEITGSLGKTKDGKVRNTQKNRTASSQALTWKYMALMKVGTKIVIPERRFIGAHPKVDEAVKQVADRKMEKFGNELFEEMKKKLK